MKQKASKASVHYEPEATGSDYCGICSHFERGKRAGDDGACKIVLGRIHFKGWCEEFSSD